MSCCWQMGLDLTKRSGCRFHTTHRELSIQTKPCWANNLIDSFSQNKGDVFPGKQHGKSTEEINFRKQGKIAWKKTWLGRQESVEPQVFTNNTVDWNQHLFPPSSVNTWPWYLLPTLSLQMLSVQPFSGTFFQAAGGCMAAPWDSSSPLRIKLLWYFSTPMEMSEWCACFAMIYRSFASN